MEHTIIDLNGNSIVVTDIDAALNLADFGRNAKHDQPGFEALEKKQNAYWQDVYDKLQKIKEKK